MRVRSLRDWRRAGRLTQKQLGERVGVSQSSIALYETGERVPSLDTARRLAEVLGVPLDQIDWPERPRKGA